MAHVSKNVTITFPGIDWDEMKKQKSVLFELSFGRQQSRACRRLLEGVIAMYDHIQDTADAQGHPVQFHTEEDDHA